MNYDLLFEPVQIGPVTSPNRFFAVPHATGHGHLQPQGAIALRETKAKGGWGTVIVQITEVSNDCDMGAHPVERIWDEVYLPAHVRQVEQIKQHGALTGIELVHGGMRARNFLTGMPVMGPSHLPIIRPEIPAQARAMSKADIRRFRDDHRRAAQLAKRAGYDILYVYAAHDISLLSNFLYAHTNQRSDEYGGSLENRARLLREVLEDTLEVANGECAVALRFSVNEVNPLAGITADAQGRDVVEMLAGLPDLWDVNISGWSMDSNTSRFSEEGHQLGFTDFVKQVTDKPVVGVGRFTSPDKMLSVVKAGRLDLIGAARPSIADPYLPNKVREGRLEDIRECIGCNICVASDSYGIPLRCTQNPTISEEWRRDWHPEQIPAAKQTQHILIVGAGPAGLECAWTLARAGHQVTLAEAAEEVGGRVLAESALTGLSTWRRVVDYRLYQLQQCENVAIYPANRLSVDDLAEFEADQVVIATGAHWRNDGVGSTNFTPLPWLEAVNVLTPDDVMSGEAQVAGPVVVYDDDHFYMGGVLAEELRQQGHEVCLVTPHAEISAWTANTLEQGKIMKRLAACGVAYHMNLSMQGFKGGQLLLHQNLPGGIGLEVECGTLVFVGARLPDDALYEAALDRLPEGTVHLVGDGCVPATIQAAVFSGHRVARGILAGGKAGVFRLERPDLG